MKEHNIRATCWLVPALLPGSSQDDSTLHTSNLGFIQADWLITGLQCRNHDIFSVSAALLITLSMQTTHALLICCCTRVFAGNLLGLTATHGHSVCCCICYLSSVSVCHAMHSPFHILSPGVIASVTYLMLHGRSSLSVCSVLHSSPQYFHAESHKTI